MHAKRGSESGGGDHSRRKRWCWALLLALASHSLSAVAATYLVNSVADPGDGVPDTAETTLREAITAANATPGADVIAFNIAGAGPQTLQPLSQLPAITDAVTIDGTTQPGYAGLPLIELDGRLAATDSPSAAGLRIEAGDCEVRGLIINRFSFCGIFLAAGHSTRIAGNFLGTDATGTVSLGNGSGGSILVSGGSNGHRIGGTAAGDRNVISPIGTGINVQGGEGLLIQGNYIGTEVTGAAALANPAGLEVNAGIDLRGADCKVGGPGPGEGNLISGCQGPNPAEWWNNGRGIEIWAPRTIIQGNRVGTDATGSFAIPNELGVNAGGSEIQIGGIEPGAGNLISGNGFFGLTIGERCTVQGNLIGTDISGRRVLPNGATGLTIGGANNLIGGFTPAARNLISGNTGYGLTACSPSAVNNRIAGNWFGMDITGTNTLGNNATETAPSGTAIYFCSDSGDNVVGGVEPGAGNVISGNSLGVFVISSRNRIQGNFFGTDPTGTMPIRSGNGIHLLSPGSENLIGGAEPGAGNVVSSATASQGRAIAISSSKQNRVLGNRIGTDINGVVPFPNGTGVGIWDAADNVIGGVAPGEANVIAYGLWQGVGVNGDSSTNNTVRGNSIHANGATYGGLGLDLGEGGVLANDERDYDPGPNRFQNYPVIDEALSYATHLLVRGRLNSTPSSLFALDFYANEACHASGHGEGQTYLGWITVTTDASGLAVFDATLPILDPAHRLIAATATDSMGNTSEFSACARTATGWPEIASVLTAGNLNGVTVRFSRPLDETVALLTANYAVSGGVTVQSVTLLGPQTVRLNTSLIPEGTVYTLTARDLLDVNGGLMPQPADHVFFQTQGGITRFEYHDVPGYLLEHLTASPKHPHHPDVEVFTEFLETPLNVRDNYGVVFRGYVTAPVSGEYTFYIASDDQGDLWLSMDDNPANKIRIAQEPGWNPSRSWISGPTQNLRMPPPPGILDETLFIEAEDFDFDGGQFVQDQPTGMTGAYPGGAYAGRGAVAEVDYHDPGANESPVYRSAAQGVATAEVAELNRGAFAVSVNHVIVWSEPGEWYNYTRRFPDPAEAYHVYARLSSGGADIAARLDEVTAGATTTNQTTVKLGEFRAPSSGNWGAYHLVPLLDDAGALASTTLSGERTLRFTVLPGNLNVDCLLFKPADADATTLANFRPLNQSAPIPLAAGHKYYIEARMKEAGGGDNLAVTWRKPGQPAPTNGAPPIPAEYLSGMSVLDPVQITTQPQTQTTDEFGTAVFRVTATGAPPLTYQWFKNGLPLPGATTAALVLDAVPFADDGAVIHVLVANGISAVRSAEAQLTVIPDQVPPEILSVRGSPTFDRVTIRFSEPVRLEDAADPGNYTLDGGLALERLEPSPEGLTLVLITSRQAPGQAYTLTLSNLRDRAAAANPVAPGTRSTFTSFALAEGFLLREVYRAIVGNPLSTLTNNGKFPDWPDAVGYVGEFDSPRNVADDYGVRLSGFLIPPLTGDYRFFLSADGPASLLLSTDDRPENLRQIAYEPNASDYRDWRGTATRNPAAPENRSELIPLEAGRLYYVEALMKARAGYDHLGVAWQKPGGPEPVKWDPPISGAYLATYATTQDASVSIISHPQSITVREGDEVTFKTRALTSLPFVTYQWQQDGVDIARATYPDYLHPHAAAAEHGSSFRCLVRIPGTLAVSEAAILSVETDTEPPCVLSAEGSIGRTKVTLRFSEPVDPGDASNPANYQADGGLTIASARVLPDGQTVVLGTSPQTEGQVYRFTLQGIHDVSAAGNAIDPDTAVTFIGWVSEEFVGPFPSWADARRDFGALGDGVADDTAALQAAIDSIGWDGRHGDIPFDRPHVLYLPAGTYRITSRLLFKYRISVGLIGEDPETTRIVWDGPEGGTMLHCNGLSQGKISRLTFDGRGRTFSVIDHKWDNTSNGPHGTTANEYSDLIIQDTQFGLRIGVASNDDGGAILRCRFLRCSEMGIAMESDNALDWWAWYCVFEDCGIGAGQHYRGMCNVYHSLFLRSKVADVAFGSCTGFISFRHNTSIESKAFFQVGWIGCAGNLTIQGNTLIDPLDAVPIVVFQRGPVLLLDNVIRSRPEVTRGPVVAVWDNLVSVGNTFTVPDPLVSLERFLTIDDRVVDRAGIEWDMPELPGFLPNRHRVVFEVPAGANATTIQQAVDAAAAQAGMRPVVHLPPGQYHLDRTLVIPAGSDLQLVGDGRIYTTMLDGQVPKGGELLRLEGPSQASLRDFAIWGGSDAGAAIAINQCDQAGARIFGEQVSISRGQRHSFLVDRLARARVEIRGLEKGNWGGELGTSMLVVGAEEGPGARTASVNVFGGQGGGEVYSYGVAHGGRLLVQDFWYEGALPTFARLADSGTITFHGMNIATDNGHPEQGTGLPSVEVDGFRGDVAFLASWFPFPDADILVHQADPELRALFLGISGYDGLFENRVPDASVLVMNPLQYLPDEGHVSIPGSGFEDPAFVRRLLAQTRQEAPCLLGPLPPQTTDVRLFRVNIGGGQRALHLSQANASPSLASVPDQITPEKTLFSFPCITADADLPFNQLTYALGPGAPPDAHIDPSTGVFNWTPRENEGPGVYPITLIVTDDGSPPLYDQTSFTVTVNEVNQSPTLGVPEAVDFDEPLVLTDLDTRLPASSIQDLGNGDYDFSGWGGGFWWDTASFAHQTVTGDFDVRVRIDSLEMHTVDTAAGLMARELLQTGSRMFCLLGTVAGMGIDGRESQAHLLMLERDERNGNVAGWGAGVSYDPTYPHQWLRIRRQNQSFVAYRSPDGEAWQELVQSTASEPLPQTLYVGLAVSAGAYDRPALTRFRDYRNLVTGLAAIADQTVVEGEALTIELLASDSDLPVQTLTFSSDPGTPDGANIDPVTGVFTWTPASGQGSATYPITVRVTDNGEPPLSDAKTFTVTVLEPLGYEADVAPRPNGSLDGKVTVTDWVQVGRFVAGLDTPDPGSEFQRADCALRETLGNGALTVSDWVQAGRYAAGLDPVVGAGGPRSAELIPTSASASMPLSLAKQAERQRAVEVRSLAGDNASGLRMAVRLQAMGDENAIGFSLGFDAAALRYRGSRLGTGARQAQWFVNTSAVESGRIGFVLALPAGQTFEMGPLDLIEVQFEPVSAPGAPSAARFFNDPIRCEVVSVDASELRATWTGNAGFDGPDDAGHPGETPVGPVASMKASLAGGVLTISWPTGETDHVLESSPSIGPGATWTPVPNLPRVAGGSHSVTLEATTATRFYRLRGQ
jgi:hypothetical protein